MEWKTVRRYFNENSKENVNRKKLQVVPTDTLYVSVVVPLTFLPELKS